MDTDKIMRQIQEMVTKKQDEILADFKNFVETSYCPIHGQFAEYEGIDGQLGDGSVQLKFTTCCDALREEVQAKIDALKATQ